MGEYLRGAKSVFVGHTHPAEGKWYKNFSFGDLSAYSDGIFGNDIYEKRAIETAGCMLTADGKIRMCFFDPDKEDFFVFDNIKVKNKTGTYDFEYFFEEMKALKKQQRCDEYEK